MIEPITFYCPFTIKNLEYDVVAEEDIENNEYIYYNIDNNRTRINLSPSLFSDLISIHSILEVDAVETNPYYIEKKELKKQQEIIRDTEDLDVEQWKSLKSRMQELEHIISNLKIENDYFSHKHYVDNNLEETRVNELNVLKDKIKSVNTTLKSEIERAEKTVMLHYFENEEENTIFNECDFKNINLFELTV